jgi:uncharacterized protein YndB with AHSA1/START domain
VHRLVPIVSVVVLLLGLAVALGGGTTAQEDTLSAEASSPLVGAWKWLNESPDPYDDTYAIFHADGTYVEVVGPDTVIGSWRVTGERTADVTSYNQDVDPFDHAFNPGTLITRIAVELNEAGDTLTAQFTADGRAPDGTILFQAGPFTATGTRIEAEPMVPFESPAAGTPAA